MGVKGSVGEALPLVLPEETGVPEADVVDLVPGAFAVQSVPTFLRSLPFPGEKKNTLWSKGN